MFFANGVSLRRFSISPSAKKSLGAEIAETFDYVSYLLAFKIASWNWQLHFPNQFVEWLILLEDIFLFFFVFVLSLESDLTEVLLEYIEFWFLSNFPTFLQNLRLYILDECDNQHILFATKSLLKKLTANGIYFMNWETKWLKILKIKQSSVGFH